MAYVGAHKKKSVEVAARPDGAGRIVGYAATFTREPDYAGDVIAKGAFSDWLKAYRKSGQTLPLLYNHDQSLDSFLGKVTEIYEDAHGLRFTATFDDTPAAQRARQLAQDGRLAKFSFAYMVRDQAEVRLPDGRKANELRKLDVDEVSLVLTPANPDTSVVEVKGREAEAEDIEAYRKQALISAHKHTGTDIEAYRKQALLSAHKHTGTGAGS